MASKALLPILSVSKRLSLFYAPTTIYSDNLAVFLRRLGFAHRVVTLSPLQAGRNHLNEEIIPLLPTGIGE
jgi:hypothetical protein